MAKKEISKKARLARLEKKYPVQKNFGLSREQIERKRWLKQERKRRKSIKLRPLTDYSDAELLAARKLAPENTELFVEARKRGLLNPISSLRA